MQVTLSEYDRQAIIEGVTKSLKKSFVKPYLNKREVCDYLGMSPGTLSTLMKRHSVPYVGEGGKKWFAKVDIDLWFEELKS